MLIVQAILRIRLRISCKPLVKNRQWRKKDCKIFQIFCCLSRLLTFVFHSICCNPCMTCNTPEMHLTLFKERLESFASVSGGSNIPYRSVLAHPQCGQHLLTCQCLKKQFPGVHQSGRSHSALPVSSRVVRLCLKEWCMDVLILQSSGPGEGSL